MDNFFFPEEVPLVSSKPKTVSEEANKILDASFKTEALRDYLGASSLGDTCARRLQYQRLGILPDVPFSGTQQRIFELGHVLEAIMAHWLREAGFVLETVDPATQKPFEFEQASQGSHKNTVFWDGAGGQIRGHVDGILRDGPLDLKYPLLWEAKTMKASLWRDFVKHGCEISHPRVLFSSAEWVGSHYFVQVQIYMAYLGLESCLLTALNKDTAEIHHELILFHAQVASNASDRAVHILKALENNEMLPRIATKQDYFECKMCRFHKTCWEGE
ncbi:hypothetical protein AGMMS49949_09060 [Alphaproteobacteria bacterium]|nr:hypothetical protein AGMMS49949_09060 [Alphaproteobacteria bacterium]